PAGPSSGPHVPDPKPRAPRFDAPREPSTAHHDKSPSAPADVAASVRRLAACAHRLLNQDDPDPAQLRELRRHIVRLQEALHDRPTTPLAAWLSNLRWLVEGARKGDQR